MGPVCALNQLNGIELELLFKVVSGWPKNKSSVSLAWGQPMSVSHEWEMSNCLIYFMVSRSYRINLGLET